MLNSLFSLSSKNVSNAFLQPNSLYCLSMVSLIEKVIWQFWIRTTFEPMPAQISNSRHASHRSYKFKTYKLIRSVMHRHQQRPNQGGGLSVWLFYSNRLSESGWISWLWHYVHCQSIPLYTVSWSEPLSRYGLYKKGQNMNIQKRVGPGGHSCFGLLTNILVLRW